MKRNRIILGLAACAGVVLLTAVGVYLVAHDPGVLRGRQEVLAVGPATVRSGAEETIAVRVVRHGTDAPIAGARLRLARDVPPGGPDPTLVVGKTGEDGAAALRFRLGEEAPAGALPLWLEVESELGRDRIKLNATAVEAGPGSGRVLLAPAKTLFQPGEVLEARALVLGPEGGAAAPEGVDFDLLAPGGVRVARHRTRTSALGVASASIPLDAEAPEGAWRLRLFRRGGGQDESGRALLAEREVSVRRYRLPAFRVAVATDRRTVRPGEAIAATATAVTFDGQPVAGAAVRAALRDDRGSELAAADAVTDAQGAAHVRLGLDEGFDLGPVKERRVFVEVEARDGADRTARGAAVVFASAVALRVSALPEGGALVPGIENRVYLVLEGPGGVPVGGEIEVARTATEAPARLATGAEGLARLEGMRPTEDEVLAGRAWLRVRPRATGTEGKEEWIPVKVDAGAAGVLRVDRPIVAAGARVSMAFVPAPPRRLRAGARLVVLVERDGRTVGTASLVAESDRLARGEATVPATGTGFVRLTALVPEGDDVREVARRVLVRSDLQVTLEPGRRSYAPGETVRLKAHARRADGGAPAGPCAIGLQAIDRALAELGHAVDFRTEVLRIALGGDPGSGRLGRGFAVRVLDGGAGADATDAAIGAGDDRPDRLEASTAPSCRAQDALVRARLRGVGKVALWALVPAALAALVALYPGVVRGLVVVLAAGGIVAAISIPNLIEARKGSNEAAAVGALRTLSTARALQEARGLVDGVLGSGARQDYKFRIAGEDGFTWSATANPASPGRGRGPSVVVPVGERALEPDPRSYFPETLLFMPEVILDERGDAEVSFVMADALTEWRIDAVASTAAGAVAHAEAAIVSRREFHVDLHAPRFVRVGDEVELTAAVRNDGEAAVEASVALEPATWFEARAPLQAGSLRVGAGGVGAARFRVRAVRPGEFTVTLSARGAGASGPSDAARRPISVRPVGRLLTRVVNGELDARQGTARISIAAPGGVAGSERSLVLRLTPSAAAEAVEGVEALLREPHGCFEQTSATTWPNTLVLAYLRSLPGRSADAEARALKLVRAGYQRLIGFEVGGSGGFSLFGHAPASPWLTAWGLREFTDIGRVTEVDAALLSRIRAFLISAQAGDGSFPLAVGRIDGHYGLGIASSLATTAYVLTALVEAGETGAEVDRAGEFVARTLGAVNPDTPTYALALAAEALAAWARRPEATAVALRELAGRAERMTMPGGRTVARFATGGTTLVGTHGGRAQVETAAIAARALASDARYHEVVGAALSGLIQAREGSGWGTTQATVQALATLSRCVGLRGGGRGTVEVVVGGAVVEVVRVGETHDRSVAVALDGRLPADGGPVEVELRGAVSGTVSYQAMARARVPWGAAVERAASSTAGGPPRRAPRLTLAVRYDATATRTGAPVRVRVECANEGELPASAPVVEVPFPAGFELADEAALGRIVAAGAAQRGEPVGSGVVLYLADMAPGARASFDLVAIGRHAGLYASGAARAWPYYNPEDEAVVEPVLIRVDRE